MMRAAGILIAVIAVVWLAASSAGGGSVLSARRQHPGETPISLSTLDRLEDMAWWPTKGAASRNEYAGTAECAKCHFATAASQLSTEMAGASTRSMDPETLDGHKTLTFQQPPYTYEILRSGDQVLGSVRNGQSSISRPLLFAFGKGNVGHTYIYKAAGNLFESRVSYYAKIGGLDLTTGHSPSPPAELEKALGRQLEPEEAQRCFACHATVSTTARHFDPEQSIAGVTCEACHGPGLKHVQAMKAGNIDQGKKSIFNPRSLDAASSVDFCGACHRTFGDVVQMNVNGVATVRFQPFRLEESRCWRRTNGQLTCVTCHDPHKPMVQEIVSYDRICLRCHRQSSIRAAEKGHRTLACSVGKVDCAECHMPKVEIPGMHHAFTDHWIRIARKGEPYPN
jgi:predicted CXXCH cytochrome family protein